MKTKIVHLFGGPFDGRDCSDVPRDTHGLACGSVPNAIYNYCPHATAHFSSERGRDTEVFIHTSIEHDFFHPSIKGA